MIVRIFGRGYRFLTKKIVFGFQVNRSKAIGITWLLCRRPIVYQSEIIDENDARFSALSVNYKGKAVHIARVGRRLSTYRSVYRIMGGKKSSLPTTVRWDPVGGRRYEIHGQSVAAYSPDNVKIAELLIQSNVPSVVRAGEMGAGQRHALIILPAGTLDARLSVRKSNFQIVERGVGTAEGWKSWQNVLHLNYWLDRPLSTSGEKSLTVVFSALSAKYDFTYNYKSALSESDSYRLYLIDDFGQRGSYYFADHRDTTIYDEVQLFLRGIITKLGLTLENVIFAGSSKGGTGALLHGLAIGVGKVIIGAPQVYPGTYLQKAAPDILNYIAGGSGDDAKQWLDREIVDRITTANSHTIVRIVVGAKDHHLQHHVRPLLEMTNSPRHNVKALIIPELTHENIGSVYRHYINNVIALDLDECVDHILPNEISIKRAEKTDIVVNIWFPVGELVACELYCDAKLVGSVGYTKENCFGFSDLSDGRFRLRFFRRYEGDAEPFACFESSPL